MLRLSIDAHAAKERELKKSVSVLKIIKSACCGATELFDLHVQVCSFLRTCNDAATLLAYCVCVDSTCHSTAELTDELHSNKM